MDQNPLQNTIWGQGLNTSPFEEKIVKPTPMRNLQQVTNAQSLIKPAAPVAKTPILFPKKNTAQSTPSSFENLPEILKSIGNLSTKYGTETRYEKYHPGIDLANVKGTPIPSPVEGEIVDIKSGYKHGDKGFGNQVVIKDLQGNNHIFSHLDKINARVGQQVKSGEVVSTMGDSGSTYSPSGKGTGSHLDYRIVDAYKNFINPNIYFNKKA